MFLVAALAIAAVAFAVGQSMSHTTDHGFFAPADIKWADGPASLPAGAKVALLEGNPALEGPFTMRVQLPDGFTIPPHWHPAVEHVTVISGTFNLGMGEKLDTVIQLHGQGPWKINYVNSADDPRNKK
jgi:hypothetical protein